MTSEHIGSLSEEAAKLLAVLQGWATDSGRATDKAADSGIPPAEDASPYRSARDTESGNTDQGHRAHDPLAPECRWCPLCRLVRAAQATSPEVREHLTNAATSFGLAVEALLETPPERRGKPDRDIPVENDDLAED